MAEVKFFVVSILSSICLIVLTACGGGGGSSSSGSGTGQVSFAVTDAPVTNAQSVNILVAGIELKPAGGERIDFTFDEPISIDLLQYQGNDFLQLIDDETVVAGRYNWARLNVIAEQGNDQDSYIILNDGSRHSLRIPSGNQSGLKVNTPFDVEEDGSTFYTFDFDLKKSVHDPQGMPDYILRPTVRLVKNENVGTISGTVAPELVMAENCVDSGGQDDAVYVYSGADIAPDDIDTVEPEPVSTANVTLDPNDGLYKYTAGFLEQGEYTVAFTCQAANDMPDADDAIDFVMPTNATVVAGETTQINFGVMQ